MVVTYSHEHVGIDTVISSVRKAVRNCFDVSKMVLPLTIREMPPGDAPQVVVETRDANYAPSQRDLLNRLLDIGQ
jgi:hypothetical protein